MIFQCPQVYTYVYFHYNIQAQYQHIENQNFRLLLAKYAFEQYLPILIFYNSTHYYPIPHGEDIMQELVDQH